MLCKGLALLGIYMKSTTSYCLTGTAAKLCFLQNGVYFSTLETESCQASNKSVLILIFDCFHEHILEVYTDFNSSSVFVALFSLKCHVWKRCYKTITRNLMLKQGNVFEKIPHLRFWSFFSEDTTCEILEHLPLIQKPKEVLH